ncbi:MAG: hypothetical protein DME19_11480 [Verrucomicrobia bacterium]|nr:MAG: hypothetical protein DME19_11480 [Verrucomicrobiota bacterium]
MVVPGSLAEVQLARVKSLLSNGCTVLAVVRDASANHNLGELAGGVLQEAEAGVSGYAMLGQIDFQHPLFAPFADPRYSDFTRIHFWKHRRVRFLDPQGGGDLSGARVLARFDDGDPAFVEFHEAKAVCLS